MTEREAFAGRRLARWAGAAAALLFPSSCFGCGRTLGAVHRMGACPACWASLVPAAGPSCTSCALPLPRAAEGGRCVPCASSPPPFERAVAAVAYSGFARSVVLRVKAGRRAELVAVMAEQLALAVRHAGLERSFDVVTPVPGRPLARLVRGFDHAALLAARVGALAGLPVRRDLLRATLAAWTPLKTLGAAGRRDAARHRVVPRRAATGMRILLVDDVLTTGATAGAASAALSRAGARSVGVAVWARTPEPGFDPARARHV